MIKFRYLTLILLSLCSPLILNAQDMEIMKCEDSTSEVKLAVRAGHNAVFGGFLAMSLETDQTIYKDFAISGGVQYNTIGRTALEARPTYILDFDWGRIVPELLLTYTNFTSINSFAAGAGASGDFGRISAKLGYYYHIYGGRGGKITEPFNLYYELTVHLLDNIDNWKVGLTVTNNEIFELERHYQPTFIAECHYYPTSRLGVSFGVGCKPAGMFHLSADYYQTNIKTGVCYRW